MKIKINKYLLSFNLFFVCALIFAQSKEPPSPKGMLGAAPPPPPGLPVDNWIPFIFVIALFYAFYLIKFKSKKVLG